MIQVQPTGTMLAVMAGEEAVRPLLRDGVSIATINAPTLCVVSGSHDDIASMEAVFADAKMECRPVHTSHAFHSAMMEPVVAPFTELLEGIQLNSPQIPFVSNLTAAWITDDEATNPSYWAQHLRQAVRFADGCCRASEQGRATSAAGSGPRRHIDVADAYASVQEVDSCHRTVPGICHS